MSDTRKNLAYSDNNNVDLLECMPNTYAKIFLSHGGYISDKWEHYIGIYEAELRRFCESNRPMRLLEIGVQNGGSLQIWSQYLPQQSTICGIDIDPKCAELFFDDGIHVLIGDAGDKAELDRLLGDARFDIIVDDGSHRSDDVLATFNACFPRLELGGLYIVEDLHCSYLASHGGGFRRHGSAMEWFKSLADALNADYFQADALTIASPSEINWLHEISHHIARVTFYDSMVVIERLKATRERAYRRIITGQQAPVTNTGVTLLELPVQQLQGLMLPPATAEAFVPAFQDALASARTDLASTQMELETSRKAEITARMELEASRKAEITARMELEARRKAEARVEANARAYIEMLQEKLAQSDEAVRLLTADLRQAWDAAQHALSRAEAAEMHVQALQSSTMWQATWPIRMIGQRTPAQTRLFFRRAARVTWWTATGQIRRRLQERAARAGDEGTAPALAVRAGDEGTAPALAIPEPAQSNDYTVWCATNTPDPGALALQRRIGRSFSYQPCFSILVPLFRTPLDVFEALVASVRKQTYEAWELCLVLPNTGDDAKELVRAAHTAEAADSRIRLRVLSANLGISGNSNVALEIASGDWVALLDHDDLLTPDALFHLARTLNAEPDADFLYTDKDLIDRSGTHRKMPLFKPAWSPEIMLNANYLTHLCAMPTARLRETGGWDPETDGAQDWDLFLRVIGRSGKVVHVPSVLYHWREIASSVSIGGMNAKPYVAQGQLRTLTKHLPAAGWPGAAPCFEDRYIRIGWDRTWQPAISVVIVGGRPHPSHLAVQERDQIDLVLADDLDLPNEVDNVIRRVRGEVVVLVDTNFIPETEDWVDELCLPLSNPDIALVGGRVFNGSGQILDFGVFLQDGAAYPAFRGEPEHYFGPAGGCGWYRNAAAAAGGALAFRRTLWAELGGFASLGASFGSRADIAFCLEVARQRRGRLMLNPFARFRSPAGAPSAFEAAACGAGGLREAIITAFPDGDPYLNPYLDAAVAEGAPKLRLRTPFATPSPGHDFAAEACYWAGVCDASSAEIAQSVSACAAEPEGTLRRVIWIVPDFEVPFYGGIHTILRAAEHMRQRHGVEQAFAVIGACEPQLVSQRIARAFPGLASEANIAVYASPSETPQMGYADAAICTLWTTAFPLLRMRDVRRKFYFVQDWEPLFYPAGTISSLVEATYRFGFHAICNTSSLASSYAALGGRAEFFRPAVDPDIFHARTRRQRSPDEPFLLVCYARPGTPRNCFEVMSAGLIDLKSRFGSQIEIVSAGANWNVETQELSGIIRNLGLLPYAATGDLYRAADAGLVAMATRHPSYLPLELMACGAVVVTNRNPHTQWLLRDGENCMLCEMTRSDIAATVAGLVEDPVQCDVIAARAAARVAAEHSDWVAELERIHACIRSVVENAVSVSC